jgi:hypothetical protein
VVDTPQKKVIKTFIKEPTDDHMRISLTTDDKPIYKSITRKLGFKHNLYIFHLMKSFSKTFDSEYKEVKL